jgi:DNA-directed RNA polymerase specialized sigma24 family protein
LRVCGRGRPARTSQKFLLVLSASSLRERIIHGMERFTERTGRRIVAVDHTTVDVARAIHDLSDGDLLRLKALARLWTRGLPGGLGWADLLNEAIARALDGSRRWPPGVPLLAFLSGVMRSICDDHWRRARRDLELFVRNDDLAELCGDEAQSPPDPERMLVAAQALSAVHSLFAHDPPALKIIAALAEGLTAKEICELHDMSERDYDTVRKRMRRTLLRRGLEWG